MAQTARQHCSLARYDRPQGRQAPSGAEAFGGQSLVAPMAVGQRWTASTQHQPRTNTWAQPTRVKTRRHTGSTSATSSICRHTFLVLLQLPQFVLLLGLLLVWLHLRAHPQVRR